MKSSIKTSLLSVAATTALLFSTATFAAGQADFDKAYASAEAAVKKAASMKNEWRDSGKLLKKAKEAAKAGKLDKAISLAKAAEFQGKTGQQQAMAQANAGNPDYLYK